MPARADARCELRLPSGLLDRVDVAAGGRGNRSAFARRALEAALSNGPVTSTPDNRSPGAARSHVPAEAADSSPAADPPTETVPPRASDASGCPECGGALAGVLDQPGVNACVDCGWRG